MIWHIWNGIKCLTGFMRRGCERRRWSVVGTADEVNDLGVMAGAVAPKLNFWKFWNSFGVKIERKSQEIAIVY